MSELIQLAEKSFMKEQEPASILAHRWMNELEYDALITQGVVNTQTAPFSVISKEDDLLDTIPSDVPIGSVMLWNYDPTEFWGPHSWGWKFGPIQVVVRIPEQRVVWTGQGRYGITYEDYDFNKRTNYELYDEFAVDELRAEDIVSVDLYLAEKVIEPCGFTRQIYTVADYEYQWYLDSLKDES